jgi:hypothetical protein
MTVIAIIVLDALALSATLLILRRTLAKRQRRSLVAYRLGFPRGLEAEAVESFISGVSSLLPPWWKRWLLSPYVSLETHATARGITHYLLVPKQWARAVEGLLQASVPSVRYEPVEMPFAVLNIGAEYRLSDHQRAIRVEPADLSAKLLAHLQPLAPKQVIVVQWLLTPHPPVGPVKVGRGKPEPLVIGGAALPLDSEAGSALKQKQSRPLLLAAPRIGIEAEAVATARHLLRRVESVWHETRAPGVHLTRRLIPESTVARHMIERRAPQVTWPTTFNSQELSGLVGWPVDAIAVPGLPLGGCRLVPASPVIPRVGTVIADSNFPGDPRPLAMDLQARLRHTHILGPTGYGKSHAMATMISQDLQAGYGVIVLDPKGDLIETVLERVPPERQGDVIVLDPADSTRPVGLNPLHSLNPDHAETVVENLVGLFKSLYRQSWGPRLDDVLRAALLTLAGSDGATLCEVPFILTDPSYRQRLVGRIDDPIGLESFWGWYESISDAERQAAVGPVLNKVRAFSMRPRVRGIIGQSNPSLTLRDVIVGRKVLLVSLASGLLGDEAASLLGALVVAELWNATMARAAQPAATRHPVMCYLDEFARFLHLPTPMATVLAEARGMGLGLVLAHQHVAQLTTEAREAVLSNARSRILFQLPAADSRLMAKEFGGVLTADDLQGLGAYEVAVQLFAGGMTQPVATGKTRALSDPISSASGIRGMSRDRYGVDRADVERQIRARQSGHVSAPTGRRRRPGGSS